MYDEEIKWSNNSEWEMYDLVSEFIQRRRFIENAILRWDFRNNLGNALDEFLDDYLDENDNPWE